MSEFRKGYYWLLDDEGEKIIAQYSDNQWWFTGGDQGYEKLPDSFMVLGKVANEASTSCDKELDIDLVSNCDSDTKDLIEHTKRVLDLIKPKSGIAVKVLSNRVNKKLEQLKIIHLKKVLNIR